MAKKKVKQATGEEDGGIGTQPSVPIPATHQAPSSPSPSSRQKSKAADAAQSTGLAICRNKYVYGTRFFKNFPCFIFDRASLTLL